MGKFLRKSAGKLFVLVCCVIMAAGFMTGCGGSGGSGGAGDSGDGSGNQGETARTIAVEETNGTIVVVDEAKESTNAYKGMHLYSGNDVTVQKASDMTMLLDMDKYVYAQEDTHFWLEASGSSESSKTVIYLDEGAVLNRIKNPLENGSVYQVDTPNSTMAVRGTVFWVVVRKGADGQVYTYLQVFDGSVKVDLKNTEGEYNGVTGTFDAGQAAGIRGNTDISEFITGEGGNISSPIDVSSLPPEIAEKLLEYIEDGDEIIFDEEILAAILETSGNTDDTDDPADGDGTDGTDEEEHNWRTVTVRKATCTREGIVQSVCLICGQTKDRETVPMTAHKEASSWVDEKEATCTEAGSQTKSCTVCGTVLKIRSVKALGHKAGDAVTTEATCTEAGSVVTSCTVCGDVLEEQVIEALGHQPGEWTVTEPAGYGTSGTKTLSCSVCGQVLEIQTIPPLVPEYVPPATPSCSHEKIEWVVTKEATCTEAGEQTGTCPDCGETLTETIDALGHSITGNYVWITAVTCTEDGLITGTCERCGDEKATAVVPAYAPEEGHSFFVQLDIHAISLAQEELLQGGESVQAEVTMECKRCQTVSSDYHTLYSDGTTIYCQECRIEVKPTLVEQ